MITHVLLKDGTDGRLDGVSRPPLINPQRHL